MITQRRPPGVGPYGFMPYHRANMSPRNRPTMPYRILLGILSTALLAAAGCGAIEKDRMAVAMEAALTTYGEAIRWGYFDVAYSYIPADKRKKIPKDLANVQVIGYEVVQPPYMRDDRSAEQVARIDYVHKDVQLVRSLSDRQLWRYEKATNSWWLESGIPEFK
jgi:hypothetical protein